MSHFSKIKTSFVEEKYILSALKDLDYEYETGKHKLKGFNQTTEVEILVRIRLSYDIGLKKVGDEYQLIADWFGVREKKDAFINQLSQRYAYHATKDKLSQQGFDLIEETNENNEIRMVLRRVKI